MPSVSRRLICRLSRFRFLIPLAIGALWIGDTAPVRAYSVLTHEEIVDIVWKDEIRPLLLKRFPTATEAQLRQAHAYAYGGCLIQDLGYCPFGNILFSDLLHYVRTGDFIKNLIDESTNLNEYAFSIGVLSHYAADNTGHPTVNRVVSMTFPRLRRKFGEQVTYEDNPTAHIRVEFGFDLVQVAKNRYTSDRYHDFIGFEVAKPLLARAFLKTYDLPIEAVLGHEDLAIGTFRRGVSEVIPEMTRVVLVWKRLDLVKEIPDFSARKFRYNLSRSSYEREWGREYQRPRFITRVLAFCLRWVPKIGPLKAMKFVIPTPQTEDLYVKSVNRTVDYYRKLLREAGNGEFKLADMDCDTGNLSEVGEYELADWAYARLLRELDQRGFGRLSAGLRQNVTEFYRGLDVPPPTKRQMKDWREALQELQKLRAKPPARVESDARPTRQLAAPKAGTNVWK